MTTDQSEPTGHKELRTLSCRLTQAEFNVKATEFAQLDQALDLLEAEKEAAVKGFKNRIGGVEAQRAVLRDVVITRHENRDVACTWHADWASKSMLLRRDDTNEVVHARTMTAEEIQASFDYTDEGKHLPPKTDDSDPLDA
jgi:hypothetical protein